MPARQPDMEVPSGIYYGGSPADHAAIHRLHRVDEAASAAQDWEVLQTLFSDDAVVLAPGSQPVQGQKELHEKLATTARNAKRVEVLSYRFQWAEVRILGPYAFEWGQIHGAYRDPREPEPRTAVYNVLRILKRCKAGEWKVHRSIWNDAPGPVAQ